jgi:Plastocyanin
MAIVLVVAGAGIAVIAVNGPGKDKPEDKDHLTPERQSAHVVSGEPDAPASRPGATVTMKDLRFRPGAVSVEVGQAVRFVNRDDVAHTVFQDLGARSGVIPAVDSKRILPGETFEFVPRTHGLVAYICTLHPTVMIGQILVGKPAS